VRRVDLAAENFDFLAKDEQLDVLAGLTPCVPKTSSAGEQGRFCAAQAKVGAVQPFGHDDHHPGVV